MVLCIYILFTKLGDLLTELRKPAADLVDVPLPPNRHDGRLRTACKSERVAVDAAGEVHERVGVRGAAEDEDWGWAQ